MIKKVIVIILLIISIIFALMCEIYSCINGKTSFLSGNLAFILTIIFCITMFVKTKNYSKFMAVCGVIFILFVYTAIGFTLLKNSVEFTRTATVLVQCAAIIFAMISAKVIKTKTTQKIKREVTKYVSERIFDDIETEESKQTHGRKEILTIMFIDIRGFTRISEQHSAEEVTEILNNYFREVIPVIKKHSGTINKFIGDALLAVFTAESPETHARNAVLAGKEILKKLRNSRMIQEAEGKEKITAGIGINTGEVFVGCIGTEDRREYAVIGDTVNIASRTESVNRLYKTEFLITENTYKYVKDIADVIKISNVEFKGKREKINVYEVLRVSD